MAEKTQNTVDAIVVRPGYLYRGNAIPKNRIVRMTEDQFNRTQRIQPPFFQKATPDQVKSANTILDLSAVTQPKAANEEAAEQAITASAPVKPEADKPTSAKATAADKS